MPYNINHLTPVLFGLNMSLRAGMRLKEMGCTKVLFVYDQGIKKAGIPDKIIENCEALGIKTYVYEDVQADPPDYTVEECAEVGRKAKVDGVVAIGGGSSMDTAKVANLYATYPADFLAYVNPPIGEGRLVPGELKPLIAVPTTAGTGSETTGVAIFDLLEMHAKTGIAHRALRPVLGVVDPNNTRTLPKMVASSTGWDILCHAVESLTALPFNLRPAPEHPGLRPAYQGANPISDIWAS